LCDRKKAVQKQHAVLLSIILKMYRDRPEVKIAWRVFILAQNHKSHASYNITMSSYIHRVTVS